uniref:Uncharacterized protein n=1 Tax=Ditylenchus dipsaci TaxID=166011 RepID=A0A915CM81_9BILA
MDPIKTENSPLLRKINASFKALYFAIAAILIVLAVVLVLLVLLLVAASKDGQNDNLVSYNNCNCSAVEPLSKSPSLSPSSNYVSQKFRKSLFELLDYITKGDAYNSGYKWLEVLADDFGHRQVGSESLERAIDFTVEKLKEDSFDNVHTEQVDHLPHWVRARIKCICYNLED